METTAAKLEALINQASTTLDTVAHDLDLRFAKETGIQSSVTNFVQMVYDTVVELTELKEEVDSVINEQKEAQQKILSLLPELFKKLQNLEDRTGLKNHGCSDLINRFDNLNV